MRTAPPSVSPDVKQPSREASTTTTPAQRSVGQIDPARSYSGVVVAIHDGASITVETNEKERTRIQLGEIRVPPATSTLGLKCKHALHSLVFRKNVEVKVISTIGTTKSRFGEVYVGGVWINRKMLEDGWGAYNGNYSVDETLKQLEVNARAAKIGIWASPKNDTPIELLEVVEPAVPREDADVGKNEYRLWTDIITNRQINAALVRIVGDKAELRRADGKAGLFPIKRLSQNDQDYIRTHAPRQ